MKILYSQRYFNKLEKINPPYPPFVKEDRGDFLHPLSQSQNIIPLNVMIYQFEKNN
jgi:hypothetical protein